MSEVYYFLIDFFLQRVELCVRCLEMWLEHRLDDSATLIVAFQVQGRLAVIAKPLPNKYVSFAFIITDLYLSTCMCASLFL